MLSFVKLISVWIIVCALSFQCSLAQAKPSLAGKKIIEYGQDIPSTGFVKEHIAEMEKVPFDGLAIGIERKGQAVGDPLSPLRWLGWRVWSPAEFKPDDYQFAIDDLKATKFKRFTDNFIQVTTWVPTRNEEVDYFDPRWSTIAHNAACIAKVAKEGGCKGIMIDPEQYGDIKHWDYHKPKAEGGHTYEEYVVKVRERGSEFIRAINHEYPDITIFFLHGYEFPILYPDGLNGHPSYSLLSAFLDGICSAASPGTKIIDGYESSYGYVGLKSFEEGRDVVEAKAKAASACPLAFTQHVKMGFGIWLDWMPGGERRFDVVDFTKNHHSPGSFRAALANAMAVSDEYVWVWSEAVRWWNPGPNHAQVDAPAPYIKALSLAKQGPGDGKYHSDLQVRACELPGYDDAVTFAEMKKTMTEIYDFPKDGWKLKFDESNSGEQQGWYRTKLNDSKWLPVSISKFWDEMYDKHIGYGWYRLTFTAPTVATGKQVFLAVGAADDSASVWLNGILVGGHYIGPEGWDKSFALDVTNQIQPGRTNEVVIRVYNRALQGGLWKSIKLMKSKS